ncbi:unnamed protein product [Trichobilharzia regenti]|nr:unnamed protein product [Trichobilharzia regenti]
MAVVNHAGNHSSSNNNVTDTSSKATTTTTTTHNNNNNNTNNSQCTELNKWCRNILSCQLARCASCIDALCRDQIMWRNSLKSNNNSSVRGVK